MKRKTVAIVYGIICHVSFFLAVALMYFALFNGLETGYFKFSLAPAIIWDCALALSYPLLHSYFLSKRGRALLARLAPSPWGGVLTSTTFVTLTSLHLALIFELWASTHIFYFSPSPIMLFPWTIIYSMAWLLLAKAMYDSGFSLQIGSLGWLALLRGIKPNYPTFGQSGLYRFCRQPVYLSFTIILWLAPTLTFDHLLLAIIWTAYCYIGPKYKEARFLSIYGEDFAKYQRAVPYWLPALSPKW